VQILDRSIIVKQSTQKEKIMAFEQSKALQEAVRQADRYAFQIDKDTHQPLTEERRYRQAMMQAAIAQAAALEKLVAVTIDQVRITYLNKPE